jgi:hypothetical protein
VASIALPRHAIIKLIIERALDRAMPVRVDRDGGAAPRTFVVTSRLCEGIRLEPLAVNVNLSPVVRNVVPPGAAAVPERLRATMIAGHLVEFSDRTGEIC